MKNKKDPNELNMLSQMKKNVQKEFNKEIQVNLNTKYNLESIKGNKKLVEANKKNWKNIYNQITINKEKLNEELLRAKQEYDELIKLYKLKKNEDA